MRLNRRKTMHMMLLAGTAAVAPRGAAAAAGFASAPIRWIDGKPPASHGGQTFGVAWPRGVVRRASELTLAGKGGAVAGQSRPLATWPDGSLKWSAHALPADLAPQDLHVARGRAPLPAKPVRVAETAASVVITSGEVRWEIAKTGEAIVRGAQVAGRAVIGPVALLGSMRSDPDKGDAVPFAGAVESVTVEQRGPVRAVVRIEGRHAAGERRWLPFTVRLYAYAGSNALQIVHSFVYDGDPARDFIASLGIRAEVPMRGAMHDRHVRLATDAAPFAEAVRPLTGLRRDPGTQARAAQIAGRAVDRIAEPVKSGLERIPAWGDFRLEQPSANGFTLAKRTGPGHGWIAAGQGKRAPGLAWIGGPEGGAAMGARYFWQRHPSALHVDGASSDAAQLTAWLWSPDAPAMDLRPYRGTMGMDGYDAQNEALNITYEDYEPGWGTPTGIARTSELTLWALPATPSADAFAQMAANVATPPRLMADPAHLHAAGVLGSWSLPDRSTPNRARIEDRLSEMIDFYDGEVDRRAWYGFWDHGDVMHTYDEDRRQWRYDIGGYAWANSELSPDLWLWTAALRSGDAKAFRLAEAMTRHTGEVDVYHLGRFAGLGTRHGIQHFSDSSKQPRVSNAFYRRIFYYLTADERAGDLMRALVTSDQVLKTVEIGRKVPGARMALPAGTIDMTFGTTWCVLAGAWLTEWERTGDPRWRDRLIAGMDSIGRLKHGWMSGNAPYDLASGRFVERDGQIGLSHLNSVFGAVEVNTELLQLLDVPRYRATWLEYCRWYNAPRAAFTAKFGVDGGGRNLEQGHSRLTAYAAWAEQDAALADRAAAEFARGGAGLKTPAADPRTAKGGIVEWPDISTNTASQWGLAAIQNLALVPQAIDRARLR